MSKTPGPLDDTINRRMRAVLRGLAAFVLFPNLLFLIVGVFFYTERALINIDYALLGAVWLWLPLSMRVSAFALLVVLDAIASTAPMYNIHPLAGVVALIRAPVGLIIVVIIGLLIAILLAAAVGYFAVHYLSDRRRRYLILASMTVAAIIAAASGIAASSAATSIAELRARVISSTEPVRVEAASDSLRAAVERNEIGDGNVVVVLMESLGQARDPALRKLVWEPFDDARIDQRYTIRRGDVAYRGGTTSGELRELCGVFADYITMPRAVFAQCLPRALHARGFTTYAVHGFTNSYYDRKTWYPLLFDSSYFQEDLTLPRSHAPTLSPSHAPTLSQCGTQFLGICDRDVFTKVESLATGGSRRFIYWLTMDAHTPVESARRTEFESDWNSLKLNDLPACRSAPEVCLQALFWRHVTQRIAALARDPRLPPTRFLMVGDHAPAFVRRGKAEQFVAGRVPYVELIP